MTSNILITGGLGYIGSHTVIDLLNKKYNVIIVDNCSNSSERILDQIKLISNNNLSFYKVNITNYKSLEQIFLKYSIDSVIHFAALKSIPESIAKPELYFKNNIHGLQNIIDLVLKFNIKNFIFSSSAAVYSNKNIFPVDENAKLGFTNPYAETKLEGEKLIKKNLLGRNINIAILRYFNPVGNHSSGLLGDEPKMSSSNIIPMIYKAIIENSDFTIFGDNYNTSDGTAVRDFIHVVDLAEAHENIISFISNVGGIHTFNVGHGHGISVRNFVNKFINVNKVNFNINVGEHREGDLVECYADCKKILSTNHWQPKKNINDMVKDSYTYLYQNFIKDNI